MEISRIPTALSVLETQALVEFARGMRVIECGALLGYSTRVLATSAAKVLSIDRHEGYGPSTLSSFMSNLEGHFDKVVPVIADCASILPFLRADRYFIDLDGTYETTRRVLEAIPFYNCGIAVHDFDRQSCHGVKQAILETPGYEIDHVVDSLAFIRRR
jgi:hypothetical protein